MIDYFCCDLSPWVQTVTHDKEISKKKIKAVKNS